MEAIGEITLSTTSSVPSSRQSQSLWNLSERQKSEIRRFKELFPSESDVIAKFAPANWANAIKNQSLCYSAPSVMLKHIDRVYNNQGLAHQIVKNNMVGVYSASTANYSYRDDMMNLVSDMFIAKFGGELNLYAMMLYFANYLLEYKGTYKEFDMQDILQQCGKKFLPWWRKNVQCYQPEKPKVEDAQLVGRDAKIWWLAQRLKNGETVEDLKRSVLYRFRESSDALAITEKDLEEAKNIAMDSF